MLKAAMDENVNTCIISLGDLNNIFMINLPTCVFDILTVNGLINLIVNLTHFSGNSETLIDSILVTDSIHVIDSDTIAIDRSISDHDGTYVTIHSGYDHNKSFTRFKILYSHKPMHYNGTEIDTNIQYQYLHAHDKMMDVTQ